MEALSMNGSNEQVKWAIEIRENVIHTMNGIVNLLMNVPGFDSKNPAHTGNIEACTKRIDAIKDCEYAWDIIDCFGGIRFTGDVYSDFGALQAVYSTKAPTTTGQHKLLMKY
jgi:hypothetical protein